MSKKTWVVVIVVAVLVAWGYATYNSKQPVSTGGGNAIMLYACPYYNCESGYTKCFTCAGTGMGIIVNPYTGAVSSCSKCKGAKLEKCPTCKGKTFLFQEEWDRIVAQLEPNFKPSVGIAPKGKSLCGNCHGAKVTMCTTCNGSGTRIKQNYGTDYGQGGSSYNTMEDCLACPYGNASPGWNQCQLCGGQGWR